MSVEIENLSYVYAEGTQYETLALKGVSLKIESGEFVGIMGQTGCGKSTLISLIAGLITPSSGKVFIDGKDINAKAYERKELRRKVGIVFQYPEYQLFETTIARDVMFGLKHLGLTKAETAERVRWALASVGFDFDKVREISPLSLSGGEKRAVAIAGVLAVEPEILIFDEPIAGLDPLRREAFLTLTDKLNANGTTIIMISHNADALAEHAGRIIIMEDGRAIMDGSAKSIFSDVKKLSEKQIGSSQSAMIAELLRECGVTIAQNVTRSEELIAQIIKFSKGGVL